MNSKDIFLVKKGLLNVIYGDALSHLIQATPTCSLA